MKKHKGDYIKGYWKEEGGRPGRVGKA